MLVSRVSKRMRLGGGLACLLALAACGTIAPKHTATPPPEQAVLPEPGTGALPQATSEASAALRSYLTTVQSSQLTQGLLRQDGGGPDTPFTADMLARNFGELVFFNEYATDRQARGVSGQLRRWDSPVRIDVVFGPSVPPSQRLQDSDDVRRYAGRLAQATGHPISLSKRANFYVFFVSEDDRAATIDAVATRLPGITRANLDAVRNLRSDIYCAVAAYASGPNASTYTAAVAVIRAENPDLLRLSCIHEELAQALGLANDSPEARPSIFNDDDEFALLTRHDELLLAMLYDRRLSTGMTQPQATPIVRRIARELTQGPL